MRGVGLALTMGQGDVGQLGLGEDVLEKSRPTLVDKIKDLVEAYAGGMHTVCLTSKGKSVLAHFVRFFSSTFTNSFLLRRNIHFRLQ